MDEEAKPVFTTIIKAIAVLPSELFTILNSKFTILFGHDKRAINGTFKLFAEQDTHDSGSGRNTTTICADTLPGLSA